MGMLSALAFAVLAQPVSFDKAEIEHAISRATGRSLTISGPLHLALLPVPLLRAEDVALSNPSGFHARALVTARELRLRVRLLPLFLGRIEVSSVLLDRPIAFLEVDAAGHANWLLAHREMPTRKGDGGRTHFRAGMTIAIQQGRIRYANARTNRQVAVEDVDAILAVRDSTATVAGHFGYRGQDVRLTAKVVPAAAFSKSTPLHLDAEIQSEPLQSQFHGTIAADGTADGQICLTLPSIAAAGAWLGLPALERLGAEGLQLDGAVHSSGSTFDFTGARMKLGTAVVQGGLEADFRGPRLRLDARGNADHVALFQSKSSPAIRASRTKGDWNRVPIPLDFLRQADGHVSFQLSHLQLGKFMFDAAHVDAVQENGRSRATLRDLRFYGGRGEVKLAVDAAIAPKWSVQAHLDDIALSPFLSGALGVDTIEGKGTLVVDTSALGANADELIHSLSGTGTVVFHDGRLRGVDLGRVTRTIQVVLNKTVGPGDLTVFTVVHGGFAVSNGILTSRDFDLQGPLLHMTGAGSVDLGRRTIDFRLTPRATTSLGEKTFSLGLPLRAEGPWSHIRYTVDVGSLGDAVARNLSAGRAPFKGLFSPSANGPASAPRQKKKHKNLGDALKNMLGIH
ncbi:MAG: AsmA family protein [Alphaproteobacteria bacterium]|nr:AsmA family protein [Alphaproteobacteria bacterium]